MFKITRKKGFHIEFENGWCVSVQFGPGNYCDNYNMQIGDNDELAGSQGSRDAECACFKKGCDLFPHPMFDGDVVGGRMTPKQVLELMVWAESQQ